ncbi:MAG: thymidine phosphorylase [Verrucomicrobiales bacterium]|jgi:thymidine phosphorylase
MIPQEIIRRKRDGESLASKDIQAFCQGITQGAWSEGQIAAFAMAICLKGMDQNERVSLTLGMRDSGDVLNWQEASLDGPVLDKHSTGGVGDGVSLVLGPLLAACGAYVPMISGRGLGHTGGTLDKLESIPGYNVHPDIHTFRQAVKEAGVAIVGQTASLAPADGKLYAVRDVTATIESIDLITASILSKKLAAGLDALVMDVKVGNGAFMPTHKASLELAQALVDVANGAGLPTTAILTDMNQCLGMSAGNALEIEEAIRYLSGDRSSDRFHQVVEALGSEVLMLGKLANDASEAKALLQTQLDSGAALEAFQRMVHVLGGPSDFAERPDHYLPKAPIIRPYFSEKSGFIREIHTRRLGMAIVALGGGRNLPTDKIDHAVGLNEVVRLGEKVDTTTPLAIIHARDETTFRNAVEALSKAITISPEPCVHSSPVILEKVTSN